MSTIEKRLIQAISEIVDENTYSQRYGESTRCSCCHQDTTYGRHQDSCPIPLLGSLRDKLMEETDAEGN